MRSIDKTIVNNNINEAYDNQTEKVKKLLDSAKLNLDRSNNDKREYSANKEKVKSLYSLNRIVKKNKETQNNIEDRIDEKLSEMQDKLDINSKNLDFIFSNVSKNNNEQINLIKDLNEKQEESIKNTYNQFIENYTRKQLEAEEKLLNAHTDAIKKIFEEKSNVSIDNENVKGISEIPNDLKNEILEKQDDLRGVFLATGTSIENKIIGRQNEMQANLREIQIKAKEDILKEQHQIKNSITNSQNQIRESVIKGQKELKEVIETRQKDSEARMINSQKLVEEQLKYLQKQNEKNFEDLKSEILSMYRKENRYSINMLLEERSGYIKELEEKDRQIRELNYRIYDMEDKLEKEKEKRYKVSFWDLFTKKKQEETEEPVFTSQILSYGYQEL